jgi:dTDP-N-acetylfucosamine:lipid II N-acetylfucosaminyltransferase
VWGTDIYNLPGIAKDFYEPLTWSGYSRTSWKKEFLYLVKLYLTNMYYKKTAYRKVNNILTWMKSEYEFVKARLDLSAAQWQFFFYENHLPYEKLDMFKQGLAEADPKKQLQFILGNSGTDTNNHVDAIARVAGTNLRADLIIPVSYGSPDYKAFLRKSVSAYRNGSIKFMDSFLAFPDYVRLLLDSDGLIMNHRRPQGYGNILMMMYLEKPVFLNPRNISIPDLDRHNLKWHSLNEIGRLSSDSEKGNKEAVKKTFSHQRLLTTYAEIFG